MSDVPLGTKPDTPCVEWPGARNQAGYGIIYISAKRGRPPTRSGKVAANVVATRVLWEIVNGPIPEGKVIAHRCDHPPCVRIDHLFVATYRENSADMIAKGRSPVPAMKIDAETCEIAECGRPRGNAGRGRIRYCWAHYAQIRRGQTIRPARTLQRRERKEIAS